MIITLICLGLVLLPIILLVLVWAFDMWKLENAFLVSAAAWTITIPCLLICSCLALKANFNADIKYENKMFERAAIVQTYEDLVHDDEVFTINTNGEYYKQVVEFNNSLRTAKKWAGNPWVNWFVVDELAEIDYIDLEALGGTDRKDGDPA